VRRCGRGESAYRLFRAAAHTPATTTAAQQMHSLHADGGEVQRHRRRRRGGRRRQHAVRSGLAAEGALRYANTQHQSDRSSPVNTLNPHEDEMMTHHVRQHSPGPPAHAERLPEQQAGVHHGRGACQTRAVPSVPPPGVTRRGVYCLDSALVGLSCRRRLARVYLSLATHHPRVAATRWPGSRRFGRRAPLGPATPPARSAGAAA
jgi:hypothetical protein